MHGKGEFKFTREGKERGDRYGFLRTLFLPTRVATFQGEPRRTYPIPPPPAPPAPRLHSSHLSSRRVAMRETARKGHLLLPQSRQVGELSTGGGDLYRCRYRCRYGICIDKDTDTTIDTNISRAHTHTHTRIHTHTHTHVSPTHVSPTHPHIDTHKYLPPTNGAAANKKRMHGKTTVFVRACVRACVHACMHACMRACFLF